MSELSIIDEIARNFADSGNSLVFGVGDDCALVRPTPGFCQLVTTDTMVSGVHFPRNLSWGQIGRRNAGASLSDIAAMGGIPRYCFSSLHLSREMTKDDVVGYFGGVVSVLRKFDTLLAGGNIVRYDGPPHFTLTVLGEIEEGKALFRNKAQIGDLVFVAGTPGDASAGLKLLLEGKFQYPAPIYGGNERLVEAFLFPEPFIAVGRFLAENGLSRCAIDCSDGFLSDLGKVCEKSGVGAELDENAIPLSPELRRFCSERGIPPLEQAYFGGDDYNLVFTVPHDVAAKVPSEIAGIPLTEIGTIVSGNHLSFKDKTRPSLSFPVKGYEH